MNAAAALLVLGYFQDPLGHQGVNVQTSADNTTQVWAKPLENGAFGVVFLNRGNQAHTQITLPLAALPTASAAGEPLAPAAATYEAFDLWGGGRTLGKFTGSITATVNESSAAFYKLVPSSAVVHLL